MSKHVFENNTYRRHSCGCYRRGVTRIDGRGTDPCHAHAMAEASRRYMAWEDKWFGRGLGALLVVGMIAALIAYAR